MIMKDYAFFKGEMVTKLQVFVYVTLAIFEIGHYRGHMGFTNTFCFLFIFCADETHAKRIFADGPKDQECPLNYSKHQKNHPSIYNDAEVKMITKTIFLPLNFC